MLCKSVQPEIERQQLVAETMGGESDQGVIRTAPITRALAAAVVSDSYSAASGGDDTSAPLAVEMHAATVGTASIRNGSRHAREHYLLGGEVSVRHHMCPLPTSVIAGDD